MDIDNEIPVLEYSHCISIDTNYGGYWVLADDINNDGKVEIISVKTKGERIDGVKSHHVRSIIAYDLLGKVCWRWGEPSSEVPELTYNVPCQIYDIDNDGIKEIIFCSDKELIYLDGLTGQIKRKYELPEQQISDSIVIANLRGTKRANDLILKDRYKKLWAFSNSGELLWTFKLKNNLNQGHGPFILDINDDGKDEVITGFNLLDSYGNPIWEIKGSKYDLFSGHMDSCKLIRKGKSPEDTRIAVSACKAHVLAVIDGFGNVVWEKYGEHYEKIMVGNPDKASEALKYIVADIKDEAVNLSPKLMIFDEEGSIRSEISTSSCHLYSLVDFNGQSYIGIATLNALFHFNGKCAAILGINDGECGYNILQGSISGRTDDIFLITRSLKVYIYTGNSCASSRFPGTGLNYSLF